MDLRTSNTTAAKIIYAAVIVLAAIGFPLYFIYDHGEFIAEISVKTLLIPFFYILFILAILFAIFNVKDIDITTEKTDKKISNLWNKMSNIFLVIICLYIAYIIFKTIYVYMF